MESNYYTDTASLKEQYRDGTNLEDRITAAIGGGHIGELDGVVLDQAAFRIPRSAGLFEATAT